MKRIFSTKEKANKEPKAAPEPAAPAVKSKPAPGLQYFTYGDVAESAKPRVGDFPQHGDTVALGAANEDELQLAKSRASRRDSETIEAGHQDIFANAPEEPLAPEGPSRRSRDASKRSSRRMSRRGSTDAFNAAGGPSSSRASRAISPERPLHIVNGDGPATRQTTRDSARISRRTSDAPAPAPAAPPLSQQPTIPILQPEPVAQRASPIVPIAQPALAAIAAEEFRHHNAATPPTAQASPVVDDTLSQIPTASDGLSRVHTRGTGPIPPSARPQSDVKSTTQSEKPSEKPSRQSTRGNDFVSRLSSRRHSQDTTTTKKRDGKRESKRASKPVPLKYFTYDDVVEGEPPVFGEEPPQADGVASRNSRSVKGKERDSAIAEHLENGEHEEAPQAPKTPTEPPRLAELPQRLSHMDMSGTGLSRRPTKDRDAATQQRASAPVATPAQAQSQLAGAPAPAPVPAPPAHRQPRALAASHGLDFSDIPGARAPQQGVPPPVNMSTKPPSKRPSKEFKGGAAAAAAAGGTAIGAVAGLAAARHNDASASANASAAKSARTSSFHEHLNDDERPRPASKAPAASGVSQQPAPVAATKPDDAGLTLAQEARKETFLPPTPGANDSVAQRPAELPSELAAAPVDQPVINRTKEALADRPVSQSQTPQGGRTPRVRRVAPPPPSAQTKAPAQAPAQDPASSTARTTAPTTALGQMGADQADGAFVSAPSTPAPDQSAPSYPVPAKNQQVPSTAEVIEKSKYNSADTTVTETVAPAVVHETVHKHIKHVREERITREVHTYDIYHRVQPIIDVEVLSTRHFLSTHDRGLVEIAEKDIPLHDANKPAWKIVPQTGSAADRDALISGRYNSAANQQGVREETKQWMHPDGYPVTETTHIHPPVLNSGGVETGRTVPFHFDHASGESGFVPPGVPTPSITRTRGNSISKSVDEAADDLNKVKLQDARAVPVTAHSGAQTLSAGGAKAAPQASVEHLSSQNI